MYKTLVASFLFISLLTTCQTPSQKQDTNLDYTKWVDPFIGTAGDGNNNPAAVVPNGLVSVAPHNHNFFDAHGPSCYHYGEPYLYGFGHLQTQGVGCPLVGSIITRPQTGALGFDSSAVRSKYSNEVAKPGYYSVNLDDFNVFAEMTATQRTGISQYHFFSNNLVDFN